MKICAISDQHGHLPAIPQGIDALFIAGDICCHGNVHKQLNWLDTTFRYWLNKIEVPVYACSGNHDWPMYEKPDQVRELKLPWTYLQDSETEFQGLKIYGTPHQKKFFDWAFNLDEIELAGKWNLIPDDTDILICHSPPKYYGDLVQRGTHEGSESLTWRIQQVRPKLVTFGHIHGGRGVYAIGQTTTLANVSVVNEKYEMVHEPWVYEM